MRGKNNGRYPYGYKEMIHSIFGVSNRAIEVCSNSVIGNGNLITVDIRPETEPDYVANGQDMPVFANETFDRGYCDL